MTYREKSFRAGAAVLVVLFSLVVAGCGDFSIADDSITPIAIPKTSCPYLRDVSARAEAAASVWYDELPIGDVEWKPFAYRLAETLPPFADALRTAIPHVPPPLADDLRAVLKQVETGIRELSRSSDFDDYMALTDGAVVAGTFDLADADARTGSACGIDVFPEYRS